jgi:hypothetical protein
LELIPAGMIKEAIVKGLISRRKDKTTIEPD